MAADTFTITPEKVDGFQMFRFEGFEGDVSIFDSLFDTYGECLEEGWSNTAVQVGATPLDAFLTASYLEDKAAGRIPVKEFGF